MSHREDGPTSSTELAVVKETSKLTSPHASAGELSPVASRSQSLRVESIIVRMSDGREIVVEADGPMTADLQLDFDQMRIEDYRRRGGFPPLKNPMATLTIRGQVGHPRTGPMPRIKRLVDPSE